MLRAGALALEERLREQGSAHTRAGLWGAERSPQHPPWVIRVDGAPSNHVWPHNQPCSEQAAGRAPHQTTGGCPTATASSASRAASPPLPASARGHPAASQHYTQRKRAHWPCAAWKASYRTQELPKLVLKHSGKVRLDAQARNLPSPVPK